MFSYFTRKILNLHMSAENRNCDFVFTVQACTSVFSQVSKLDHLKESIPTYLNALQGPAHHT